MNTITQKAFVRGVVATAGVMAQPKGSIPRASNKLLTRRGSLVTCDGSQVLHEYGGTLWSNSGRIMASFLYNPIGVPNYYLALIKLVTPLGPPQNLTLATASGGSLAAATYYYQVTAIDGVGGETTASNEASIATGASGKNILTWNVVPNAVGYNVYRSTVPGGETILIGSATAVLPVSQATYGLLTQSFIDDGTTAVSGTVYNLQGGSNGASKALISGSMYQFIFQVSNGPAIVPTGSTVVVAGCSPSLFNATYINASVYPGGTQISVVQNSSGANVSGGGGTITVGAATPPLVDTTQQTALYRMPPLLGQAVTAPISYDNTNIVALFPADLPIHQGPGYGGGGGAGGGGGTGVGGNTGGGTANGGVPGNLSFIPQIVEFTNQVVMALGNGFPPVVYSDPTTAVNPAKTVQITSISADVFGVVTIATSSAHGIPTGINAGGNVLISGLGGIAAPYNGAYPILQVVDTTHLKLYNAAAAGIASAATGTLLVTTLPIYSNFVPAIPIWSATTAYAINSVVQPSPGNLHIYKAIQAGISGGSQPSFPTGAGQRVIDGSVLWQESGLLNSAAPPPPGAAHVNVYSGALWVWNTSPTDTTNGLEGPCSLRMSDINNLNSWNPINQAFLDKDDGTEGSGLSGFTITAQGIAPQGSLVAFKNYSTYQILGLFGAANFAIQRVKTDMGATAPRTIQYVPGFGIERMTHLGIGVFDGVDDRVVSEEIRPYLFPSSDSDTSDITPMDANWAAISWAAQTANPPMYVVAIPVGVSQSALTRLLCYDLVLKAWVICDLPFPISTFAQFRTSTANPVTIMGGLSDGALSRWQAGDTTWDTGGSGARTPSVVQWSVASPTVASNDLDQKLYVRRLQIRGDNFNSVTGLTVTLIVDDVTQFPYASPVPSTVGSFEIEVAIGQDCLQLEAVIAGSGDVELYGWSFGVTPKPAGVPMLVT